MLSLSHRYAKSDDDAKDIFQEGFTKVFENLPKLRNHVALTSWMKRIFVNESLKLINANRAQMMVNLSDAEDVAGDTFDIIDELATEEITEIIRKLPDKMRITFNMYVIEGYAHAEIAEALNISVGTSKSNLHDARIYIQNQIKRMSHIQRISM